MREGVLRDSVSVPLEANRQTSWLIDQVFPAANTSHFAGSVRSYLQRPANCPRDDTCFVGTLKGIGNVHGTNDLFSVSPTVGARTGCSPVRRARRWRTRKSFSTAARSR